MLSPLDSLIFLLIRNMECPLIMQEGDVTVYATKQMSDLFGYSHDELMALPSIELAARSERQRIQDYIAQRWDNGNTNGNAHLRYQATGRRKDGSYIQNLTVTICTFPQDKPPYVRLTQFELTNQENLYQFALQAAASIHGWNKAVLRSMAADIAQAASLNLDMQLQELDKRIAKFEAGQAKWRHYQTRVVQGCSIVAGLLGTGLVTGTLKKALDWLWP